MIQVLTKIFLSFISVVYSSRSSFSVKKFSIHEKIPIKFAHLLSDNGEVNNNVRDSLLPWR